MVSLFTLAPKNSLFKSFDPSYVFVSVFSSGFVTVTLVILVSSVKSNLSDESKTGGITATKKTSSVRKTKTISSTKRSKVTK